VRTLRAVLIVRPVLCLCVALVATLGCPDAHASFPFIAATEEIALDTQAAKWHADQRRYPEALKYYKRAHKNSVLINGDQHRDSARYKNEIGVVYINMGKYAEARDFLVRAAEIVGREEDDSDSAMIYSNLGFALCRLGDYERALDWHRKAFAIRKNLSGVESVGVTEACGIGFIHARQGDYAAALAFYEQALAIEEKILGKQHPVTTLIRNGIAGVYDKKGDYRQAAVWYEKVLADLEEGQGREHFTTAMVYGSVALAYARLDEYERALENFQKAVRMIERSNGEDHPNAGVIYTNIAWVYVRMRDYDKAVSGYFRAYRIHRAQFGEAHPQTQSLRGSLERAYRLAGNPRPFEEWLSSEGNRPPRR